MNQYHPDFHNIGSWLMARAFLCLQPPRASIVMLPSNFNSTLLFHLLSSVAIFSSIDTLPIHALVERSWFRVAMPLLRRRLVLHMRRSEAMAFDAEQEQNTQQMHYFKIRNAKFVGSYMLRRRDWTLYIVRGSFSRSSISRLVCRPRLSDAQPSIVSRTMLNVLN